MARAIWDSIYKTIRSRIEEEIYPYQSFLPSENEFIAEFSCSHNTIRKALSALAIQGYVRPLHGKGVRVIYRQEERADFVLGGIESFKETAARNKLSVATQVKCFEHVIADDKLAQLTGFEQGDELIYIERVRLLDGKPLILDKSYFLAELMGGLTAKIAEVSIYDYLENTLGITIATSKRAISSERACAQDRELLDLGDYDFLSVVTGQTFSSEGIMFERTQSRHRPDHFVFYDTAIRNI